MFKIRALGGAAIAVVLVAACGGSAVTPAPTAAPTGSAPTAAAPTAAAPTAAPTAAPSLVCFGQIGPDSVAPVVPAMNTVFKGQAAARGYGNLLLDNNLDGPTALKNADTCITSGAKFAIEFQVDGAANAAINKKFADAGIPVIDFDIRGPGGYFVGIDNYKAGVMAGTALGNFAKTTWACKADLVVLLDESGSPDSSVLRIGGAKTGLLSVCGDITYDKIITIDSPKGATSGASAGRDLLAAHPDASKILVLGTQDNSVTGFLTAANQLKRGDNVFGWGAGNYITTASPANLLGSVDFALEGYPVVAFNLIDRLAKGEKIAIGDSPTNPTSLVQPCLVTRAQALAMPPLTDRAAKEATITDPTVQPGSLFCPKA